MEEASHRPAQTRDKLWKLIVTAFAIVLVGGFIALAIGLFIPIKEGEHQ